MSKETILVIDDDPLVLSVICHVLRLREYRVLEASSIDDALRVAVQNSPIDLFLIDVMLPTVSGDAAAHLLLSIRPLAKVLYMSGYSEDVVLKHLTDTQNLLKKPLVVEELLTRIAEKLGERPSH